MGFVDWLIDWLIDYCFTSRSRIFHLITGEGLQNVRLCSALRAFDQGGIFIVSQLLWYGGHSFSGLIRRTAQFSRLLRPTRGCGELILTRILTGRFVENRKLYSKILLEHRLNEFEQMIRTLIAEKNYIYLRHSQNQLKHPKHWFKTVN
jgi:hypothetical protein